MFPFWAEVKAMQFIAPVVSWIERLSITISSRFSGAMLAEGHLTWDQASEHLQAPMLVPRWATYTVIGLLAFWTILILYGVLRRYRWKHHTYISAVFGDILWRWNWTVHKAPIESEPIQITAHCLKCGTELRRFEGYAEGGPHENVAPTWQCRKCRSTYPDFSEDEVKVRIMRTVRKT